MFEKIVIAFVVIFILLVIICTLIITLYPSKKTVLPQTNKNDRRFKRNYLIDLHNDEDEKLINRITDPEVFQDVENVIPDQLFDLQNKHQRTKNGHIIYEDPNALTNLMVKKPTPRRFYASEELFTEFLKTHLKNVELKFFLKQDHNQLMQLSCSVVYVCKKNIETVIMSILQHTVGPFEFFLLFHETNHEQIINFLTNIQHVIQKSTCVLLCVLYCADKLIDLNWKFILPSAKIVVEINDPVAVLGFNKYLAKPIELYRDIFVTSGNTCFNDEDSFETSTFEKNRCYLMSAVDYKNDLIAWDRDKMLGFKLLLKKDIFLYAWKYFGFRSAYVPLSFEETKKPHYMKEKQELPHFCLNYFRSLEINFPIRNSVTSINNLEISVREKPKIHWVIFGNVNTIHFANTELALVAHSRVGIHFDFFWRFNEFDVGDCISDLPPDVFVKQRGFYFWAWKPWIIQKVMLQAAENDIIVYTDAGTLFNSKENFESIIASVNQKSYYLSPIHHTNGPYCKCEISTVINNYQEFKDLNMIDASIIAFKNSREMQIFVSDWYKLVKTPFFLSDETKNICQNSPDFVDHRHDQSLLSACAFNNNFCLEKFGVRSITWRHRIRLWKHFDFWWAQWSKEYVQKSFASDNVD